MNKITNLIGDQSFSDTMEKALELLELDGMEINIIPMPILVRNDKQWEYFGLVYPLPTPKSYNVMVRDNLSKDTAKKMLLHEAVHIKQYDDGRLIRDSDNVLHFEGKRISPPYSSYLPHEIEADNVSRELWTRIRKEEKEAKKNQKNKE